MDGLMRSLRSAETREGPFFVGGGEPAVSDDVGDQDRRKLPFELLRGHGGPLRLTKWRFITNLDCPGSRGSDGADLSH